MFLVVVFRWVEDVDRCFPLECSVGTERGGGKRGASRLLVSFKHINLPKCYLLLSLQNRFLEGGHQVQWCLNYQQHSPETWVTLGSCDNHLLLCLLGHVTLLGHSTQHVCYNTYPDWHLLPLRSSCCKDKGLISSWVQHLVTVLHPRRDKVKELLTHRQ